MKIYTRRGDQGQTDLFGGERVEKSHVRVAAYGEVDELNAALGLAGASSSQDDLREAIQRVQSTLFDIGSTLATPDPAHREKAGIPGVQSADVDVLEKGIDALEAGLPPLASFVLPGGTRAAAAFHLARTICRRVERRLVALSHEAEVDPVMVAYLNRLSDWLFTCARVENHRAGEPDVPWVGRRR